MSNPLVYIKQVHIDSTYIIKTISCKNLKFQIEKYATPKIELNNNNLGTF